MATFEALIATGGVLNLLLLKVSKNVKLSEDIILFGMILLLSAILIHGGYSRTGIYWIFTYPLLAFFLKGNKVGFLWNSLFLITIFLLMILDHMGIIPIAFSCEEIRQAILAYVIITILAYVFEDALLKSYNEVSRLAITDQLTGLYNRRYIFEKLAEEIKKASRYKKKLCVILLDIDDFKKINDQYGHDTGDAVLREVARILKENTKESYTVGRLGGEEFVIICPETDAHLGKVVAEKIRKAIENLNVPPVSKLSVSIGISEFSGREDINELLKKADIALYRAKNTGKNKIVVYS